MNTHSGDILAAIGFLFVFAGFRGLIRGSSFSASDTDCGFSAESALNAGIVSSK